MFPSVKSVKTNAKLALKGNWPLAIAAIAVPVLAVLAILLFCDAATYLVKSYALRMFFYGLAIAASVFIGLPSFLGVIRFYKNLYTGNKADFSQIFFYFSSISRYFRAVGFMFVVALPIAVISFLLLFPSFVLDYIADGGFDFLFKQGIPIWVSNLSIIATFLRCAAIAGIVLVSLKFYMAVYLFIINDCLSPRDIVYQSFAVSYYSNTAFISLLFSMLGWVVFGFLIIPLIFILPYMLMSYVTHAKYAVTFYNSALLKNKNEQF